MLEVFSTVQIVLILFITRLAESNLCESCHLRIVQALSTFYTQNTSTVM